MEYKDQLGNTITLNGSPKRIISLIPSQSEFLWEIGLEKSIVGISKFCIHPNIMYESIERVGGTKQIDIEKIRQLKPDLIIGNKEENVKEQIEELRKHYPVWMSDVNSIDDAFDMMLKLGEICDKAKEVEDIVDSINTGLNSVKDYFKGKSVAYFIWNNPLMVVGSNTYIHQVLSYLGLKNVFVDQKRYPEISFEELNALKPDYCFLSSEPFPFSNKHVDEFGISAPETMAVLVDGEMFSWYGTHLLTLPTYIKNLKLI